MGLTELEQLKKENLMDGLFGISKEKKTKNAAVEEILLSQIYPSERNCFQVNHDAAMEELTASIKEKGILEPLLVREREAGGYEVMAGHRRRLGAIRAERKTVPCMILDVSDEDRDIILADSNLQRPYILPSEKAWAIRIKYDAMKKKVGRKKASEMGALSAHISKTADVIAQKMGIGDRTVKNYIRITYLSKQLQQAIDEKKLPLKAGVQLSYLPEKIQEQIFQIIAEERVTINEEKAGGLRTSLSESSTRSEILALIKPGSRKSQVKTRADIKINKELRNRFFPSGYKDEQIQRILLELLTRWAVENNPDYEKE